MPDFRAISQDAKQQESLHAVHRIRMQAHFGKKADLGPWPQTPADWRQTPYGAPWDTNVEMAIWHLDLARKIVEAVDG